MPRSIVGRTLRDRLVAAAFFAMPSLPAQVMTLQRQIMFARLHVQFRTAGATSPESLSPLKRADGRIFMRLGETASSLLNE